MKALKTLVVAMLVVLPLTFISCEKDDPVPQNVQITENSVTYAGVKTVLPYSEGSYDATNKMVMLQAMSNSGNTITSTTVAYAIWINNFTGPGTYTTATDPQRVIGDFNLGDGGSNNTQFAKNITVTVVTHSATSASGTFSGVLDNQAQTPFSGSFSVVYK